MAHLTRHEIRDDEDGRLLATVEPATVAEMVAVVETPLGSDDGRSNWVWVRLANGDLILGCFPQGDTYELVTQTMIRGRV